MKCLILQILFKNVVILDRRRTKVVICLFTKIVLKKLILFKKNIVFGYKIIYIQKIL